MTYLPLVTITQWLATYEPGAITVGFGDDPAPGAALFGEDWAVGFAIQPDPLPAILLAGVLYPVVCGGLGGLLGQFLSGDSTVPG